MLQHVPVIGPIDVETASRQLAYGCQDIKQMGLEFLHGARDSL